MRREWIIYLALLLITAAVYWPVGQFDYINYDDPEYVQANPQVQQDLTLSGVAWAFRAVVASNWHPMTCLSLMLDCQLFGKGPGAHHLVNLLFHAANTLLVFLVWRRLTGEVWPSALVAALFAWHPLHVESVAWISERKDVLSAFFGLLTLLAYAQYVEQSRIRSPRSKVFYGLALFWFALGLMSKSMLVTWPFVMLLLDFWPLGRVAGDQWRVTSWGVPVPESPVLKRLLLEKLPFLVLATAASVATFLMQRATGTMSSLSYLSLSDRLSNDVVSYVRYLGKTVWPTHLTFFYPYSSWSDWQVAGATTLLALITLVVVWQARRRPFLIVGWLWFLGTLVPVIGLVQVGLQAMADRYTYLPLIGVFVIMAWSGKELGGNRPYVRFIRGGVVTAALAACLVTTSSQLRYWRNTETLCWHALDVTTDNVMAHFLLGEALIGERNIDESVTQLNEALQITPWYGMRMLPWYGNIHNQLGIACSQQGKVQEAIGHYQEALRFNPDLPVALNNLAWLLATNPDPKIRNGAEAVQYGKRACALTQYKDTALIGTLAAAYAEAGQFDEAIRTAEMAITSASAAGETNLLEKNRQLLELYRAGRPYHETRAKPNR